MDRDLSRHRSQTSSARYRQASWRNHIEAQFTALRSFTLDGTDHTSHAEQASTIRRWVTWRNRQAHDQRLGRIIKRANVS